MHLPDGAPYESVYAPTPSDVRTLAVGWLHSAHPYSVGVADDAFVQQLSEACLERATARTRGWHICDLCPTQVAGPTTVVRDGEPFPLGDAEVRVIARDGTWLVAPNLVLHYVTDHEYLPPRAFIEAVSFGRFAPS
jgi:hypothetical protein